MIWLRTPNDDGCFSYIAQIILGLWTEGRKPAGTSSTCTGRSSGAISWGLWCPQRCTKKGNFASVLSWRSLAWQGSGLDTDQYTKNPPWNALHLLNTSTSVQGSPATLGIAETCSSESLRRVSALFASKLTHFLGWLHAGARHSSCQTHVQTESRTAFLTLNACELIFQPPQK